MIDVSSVTTEFNTLFETVTSIAEKVDPVKLNQTLTATAEALSGLGQRFGESIVDGNAILDDSTRGCRRSTTTPTGLPGSPASMPTRRRICGTVWKPR